MGLWSRLRRKRGGGPEDAAARRRTDGPDMDVDLKSVRAYAEDFVALRRGVEAYIEPSTHITTTTVVLVAHDGEWTRRAIGSPRAGFELGKALGIPVYDVNHTGYPARMREWSSRQRRRR